MAFCDYGNAVITTPSLINPSVHNAIFSHTNCLMFENMATSKQHFKDSTLFVICLLLTGIAFWATISVWALERSELQQNSKQVERYLFEKPKDSFL